MYKVYKHTCPNGKVYIGITCKKDVTKRWGRDGLGYNMQTLFYRAINKYGWDNIHHEIIEDNLSKEDAFELEKKLIKQYDSTNPNFGYNVSTGGEYNHEGCKASNELRQHLSEVHKQIGQTQEQINGLKKAQLASQKVWLGRHHTVEAKLKMSESGKQAYKNGKVPWNKGKKNEYTTSRRGTHLSEEQKKKISIANSGKKISEATRILMSKNNARYWQGKHRSDETKEKLRQANLGKHHNEEVKQKLRNIERKPLNDITGIKYTRLTPIKYLKGSKWLCKCDCGNETIVDTRNLTSGHTRSCGCIKNERRKTNVYK